MNERKTYALGQLSFGFLNVNVVSPPHNKAVTADWIARVINPPGVLVYCSDRGASFNEVKAGNLALAHIYVWKKGGTFHVVQRLHSSADVGKAPSELMRGQHPTYACVEEVNARIAQLSRQYQQSKEAQDHGGT